MLFDSLSGYISYRSTEGSTGSYPCWATRDTRYASKDWTGCPGDGRCVLDGLLPDVGQAHVLVAAASIWRFSTSLLLLIDDVMDVIDHLLSRLVPKVYLVAIRQSDDRHLRVLYC
jgi:hypothetical protein